LSGSPAGVPATADAVRSRNGELDAALLAAGQAVPADRLRAVPPGDEWSPAHLLAHLGEFPLFFAAELRRWHADRDSEVGRTHQHPGRLAAISDQAVRRLTQRELMEQAGRACVELAEVLTLLEDSDLTATTHNVKYGEEPLSSFLDRYVLGHKAGHLQQLATLSARLDRDQGRT